MLDNYFCDKCKEEIFWDELECLWACDCYAVAPIPDEDGESTPDEIPTFWKRLVSAKESWGNWYDRHPDAIDDPQDDFPSDYGQ